MRPTVDSLCPYYRPIIECASAIRKSTCTWTHRCNMTWKSHFINVMRSISPVSLLFSCSRIVPALRVWLRVVLCERQYNKKSKEVAGCSPVTFFVRLNLRNKQFGVVLGVASERTYSNIATKVPRIFRERMIYMVPDCIISWGDCGAPVCRKFVIEPARLPQKVAGCIANTPRSLSDCKPV